MKIALYLDLPYGGAYRTMEEVSKRLQIKHDITVFGNTGTDQISTSRIISDFNSLVTQRLRQKYLAKKIDSGNFDVVFVTHDRHLQAPWILRYLKTKTVFLCQEPTRAFFEKFLDVSANLPFLNRVYEKTNRLLRKQAEVENASFATKIIANSNYSVESIFRAYGRVATPIYLGIDSKQFFPKLLVRNNQVLIVGNDEPQKGLRFAISSLSLVSKEIRPKLIIASPRSVINRDLISFAKNKKVSIKNICGLNPYQLCDVYNQSQATLATAYLEPFGLSVIESMACGTPVIAVSEGGFRETIINNKTGLLVERDSKKFASAITKLIGDKKLCESISKLSVMKAKKHFGWDNTVLKIEKLLYETI